MLNLRINLIKIERPKEPSQTQKTKKYKMKLNSKDCIKKQKRKYKFKTEDSIIKRQVIKLEELEKKTKRLQKITNKEKIIYLNIISFCNLRKILVL